MIFETGDPEFDGLYVVRQWYGYRILEWGNECWWHAGKAARWPGTSANTSIEAWSGPLPPIVMPSVRVSPEPWEPVDEMGEPVRRAAPVEYDL